MPGPAGGLIGELDMQVLGMTILPMLIYGRLWKPPTLNIANKMRPNSIIHLRNSLASGIVPIFVWETREREATLGPPDKVVACFQRFMGKSGSAILVNCVKLVIEQGI